MKNPLVAVAILVFAVTVLGAALMLRATASQDAPIPTQPAIVQRDAPAQSDSGLPYQPPDPEPDVDPDELRAETGWLLASIPRSVRSALIVDEPPLSEFDAATHRGHGLDSRPAPL